VVASGLVSSKKDSHNAEKRGIMEESLVDRRSLSADLEKAANVIPMRFQRSNIKKLVPCRPWQISSATNGGPDFASETRQGQCQPLSLL